MLVFVYFISELKKINDIIWKLILGSALVIWLLINHEYSGLLSISEDGIMTLYKQPIIWMLVVTAIGYFIARIYNRNKLQSAR